MTARSAYIHVPFCRHRCGYCNFTLVAGRDDLVGNFLTAIDLEIERALGSDTPELDTLFLGGGTPSHLSTSDLRRLFEVLHARFKLAENAEFSCEVNPLDCTPEKLEQFRLAGVNRLSVGGQSFQPRKLHRLQRDHSGDQLREQRNKRCKAQQGRLPLDLASVHVNRVRHALECVERNADR